MIPITVSLVLVGVIICFLILIRNRKKNHPNSTWPRWATKVLIALAVGIGIWFFWGDIKNLFKSDPDSAGKKPTENSTSMKECLDPRQEMYVSPGLDWTTEFIDYKFKFRANGHNYCLKFTGMDHFVEYPKEVEQFSMPLGAQPGPVVVRTGKGETQPFRVILYKKFNCK